MLSFSSVVLLFGLGNLLIPLSVYLPFAINGAQYFSTKELRVYTTWGWLLYVMYLGCNSPNFCLSFHICETQQGSTKGAETFCMNACSYQNS